MNQKKRFKILNIMEEGRFAGPHKRIYEMACTLRDKHEIESIIIFPKQQSDRFKQLLEIENIGFYAISLHRLTKQFGHLIGYLVNFIPEILQIKSIIKREAPDLVDCSGSYQLKGIVASKLAGVQNIWHMEDTYTPSYIRVLFKIVYKLFSSRQFVFVSNRTKEFYFPGNAARPLRDYAIIPASVDTSLFSPNSTFKMPFDDSFDGMRVLTVGNINTNKNHELFIDMARIFKQRYPELDVRFYIAGAVYESQRALYQSLNKLIDSYNLENVVFLGERRDIRELMNYSHVFVCPSAYEASPIAVWEALAMAMPVLSTDVGDVAQIFSRYQCGLVGDKDQPEEMVRLLADIVQDEKKRNEMGQNARRAAIEEFDIEKCALKHIVYYRKAFNIPK